MDNLYSEAALKPINLQNTYEKSLGYADADYTAALDNGIYKKFRKRLCRVRSCTMDLL